MMLWADVVIQNSTVEFYKQRASAKIYAKRIEKKKEVEAVQVDANIVIPPYQNVLIKAQKLTFDPESFNCHAFDQVTLNWGDLTVYASGLEFQFQDYKLLSQEMSEAHYRKWTFEIPEFVYEHPKKMLTCSKGGTISDATSKLVAQYVVAYFDHRFDLSKKVVFQNKDVEVETEIMHCFLDQANEIKKIDAPHKLKLKTHDGKIKVQGNRMTYENNKATLNGNVRCLIEREF